MTMTTFFVLTILLQLSCGQQQLVTQFLNPSQAASLAAPSGQGGPLGLLGGPAASLGQILINLLNYKLQWLNQLAGHLTGNPAASTKPGALPSQGFPFMTTLVTTLSGNSPSVPGVHISGAPVNHLGYPGAPTPAPPVQDFHWFPVLGPPSAVPGAQQVPLPSVPQSAAPQAPNRPPPAPPSVEDFSPIETIVQTQSTAKPPVSATTTITTPKPKT